MCEYLGATQEGVHVGTEKTGLVDNLIKREGFRSGDPASRSQAMEY